MYLEALCEKLAGAARILQTHTAHQKNSALESVICALDCNRAAVLAANAEDVSRARESGMRESMIDRLSVTDERLDAMLDGIRIIIKQNDPIGEVVSGWTHPNGMDIRQVRVPLGVAAIIYESRPNVTVDAFALAYKSGNAILLRGSSSALNSNRVLVDTIIKGLKEAAEGSGVSEAVCLADSGNRSDVDWILHATGKIDVVLPRGGSELIKHVVENARVPVIETGSGMCHIYVDGNLNAEYLEMAARIAENAKMQKPGACNAVETILIHTDSVIDFLPNLVKRLASYSEKTGISGGVRYYCCELSFPLVRAAQAQAHLYTAMRDENVVRATENDFSCEFLDYALAVKIVNSVDDAINHINKYNTKHSETIITQNRDTARRFQKEVDASCVYVNASTRFTDGAEFGLGAELGISTQKLHVRGPMGLTALTTTKYFIEGNGQIR